MKRLLFVALVCGLAALPSLGAPSLGFWEEGTQGSIHMIWDFSVGPVERIQVPDPFNPGQTKDAFLADTSVWEPVPTGVISAIGSAALNAEDTGVLTFENGVFSSSQSIDVHLKVNNFPNPNAFKELWVNITGTGTIAPVNILAHDGGSTQFTYEFLEGPGPGIGADFGWRIRPNPFFEEVEFHIIPTEGGIATLSGIHMDTICIPAPGAFLLAGLGAMAVGWLRTRRGL